MPSIDWLFEPNHTTDIPRLANVDDQFVDD